MIKRLDTIRSIEECKGSKEQEFAKGEFLKIVKGGCPTGETKDYMFSQTMLAAFIAGRVFEAHRKE